MYQSGGFETTTVAASVVTLLLYVNLLLGAILGIAATLSVRDTEAALYFVNPKPVYTTRLLRMKKQTGTLKGNSDIWARGGGRDSRNVLRSRLCQHHKVGVPLRVSTPSSGDFRQPERAFLRGAPSLCGGWRGRRFFWEGRTEMVITERDLAAGLRPVDGLQAAIPRCSLLPAFFAASCGSRG